MNPKEQQLELAVETETKRLERVQNLPVVATPNGPVNLPLVMALVELVRNQGNQLFELRTRIERLENAKPK